MERPDLFQDQAAALKYSLVHPYSIVALDPGRGKSRVAIENREIRKDNCLVVCPGYLVDNWVEQIREWAPPNTLVSAFHKGKELYEVFDSDYAIASYRMIQKAPYLFQWAKFVVLDEVHLLKSMESNRSTFIHKEIFENSTKRVLALSGTPIKNYVREFYSLISLMNYNPELKSSPFLDKFQDEIKFADRFSHRESYYIDLPNGKSMAVLQWKGLKNLEELKTHLKGIYIRPKRPKEESLLTVKPVLVRNTPNLELKAAFDAFFENDGSGSVKSDAKAKAALVKAPICVEYARDLKKGVSSPILIYSDHREAAESIARSLGVEALTGKIPPKKRMAKALEFQRGKGDFLVATVGALSMGVTLTRARNLILNDPPWVPGDLDQVFKRIDRIGAVGPCTVHWLQGSPQDKEICKALEEKRRVIKKVI